MRKSIMQVSVGAFLGVGLAILSASNQESGQGRANAAVLETSETAPVLVKFRSAALRTSFVAVLKNDAGKMLRNVHIKVENSALKDAKEWTVDQWESSKSAEFGWKEGWDFFPGDVLTITADNYDDLKIQFKRDALPR